MPTDENHLNFRWIEPGCKVLFSVSRQGNGASCHFASDKPGMQKIKQAIFEFICFVFWMFDWCEMIIAKVKLDKVKKIVEECGLEKIIETKKCSVYIFKRG